MTNPTRVPGPVSATEQSVPAQIGSVLFRHRGWLPLLFLGIPLVFPGSTSPFRWEVGLALIAIGEVIRLAGVAAAGTVTRRRSRNVQRLVTYGIFSWVRNPLYIGNFLVWMGFVTISGVLWFLPIAVLLFAVEYELIVRYEEGVLESIFGRDYLEYKNSTPRWIPRPPKTPPPPGEYHWGEAFRSEVSTFLQYAVLLAAFYVKSRVVGQGGAWVGVRKF
ncbi:MAG TPA: isoprenylcysteine carboxylmethyltransferase family protein [Gemmatimonadaceae bacterium]|nr:isoprenylcysteine carboxylmethyltransferase family protein [Gemmatimonadaceae bacterium]